MNLKELLELRAKALAEIQRLRDLVAKENRAFNSEEEVAWVKCNTDYDDLGKRIAIIQRGEAVENEHREAAKIASFQTEKPNGDREKTTITEEHRLLAFNGWVRSQYGLEPSEAQVEACKLLRLNPSTKEIEIALTSGSARAELQRKFMNTHPSRQHEIEYERRAMSNIIGASGQYLDAPTQLVRNLEVNMLAYGGMEQVAEVINTASGERMAWPTADDTSNTGAQLGESTSIGSSVEPTFTQVFWDAYKFSSKPVLVPYELIQDSQFDIAGMLGSMLGERLGRISNTKFTTGTGAATPKGITICSTLGVTSATATVITADELLGLVHSIDPAYRNGARWMFHDGILLYLRKLKDGEGRYLWQQGMGGAPDSLWGYPYTINQDMQSTVATATKTVLFGQLSKYKIRRAGGLRLYRLQERYRDTDQDGFVAFLRQDGNLLTSATAPVKHILQA